jgi:hypothetical protein
MEGATKLGDENWVPGWRERIEAAQNQPTVELQGVVYPRVRYGTDYPNGKDLCRDCGVEHGQFHVRGCCVERCPRCEDQAISCPCPAEN